MSAVVLKQPTPEAECRPLTLAPISWRTYITLLDELGEASAVRLTYDHNTLEIMPPPLPTHEAYSSALHDCILILCEELGLDVRPLRSTTLRREDLQRGLEADNVYYLRHEAEVRGAREIDLSRMPPPDLAVEVDITNPSLDKLPIYAALGVSEVWRYDGQRLRIYTLADGMYRTQSTSPAFAGLALEVALPRFIECSFTQSYLGTLRQFRQWVRDTVSG